MSLAFKLVCAVAVIALAIALRARRAKDHPEAAPGLDLVLVAAAVWSSLAPAAVGLDAEPLYWVAVGFSMLLLFVPAKRRAVVRNVIATLSAATFSLALGDLILRPLLNEPVYRRFWPPMPDLARFNTSARSYRRVSGDLSQMMDRPAPEYLDMRMVDIRTDRLGFRNSAEASRHPVDLIVLGDSYGIGNGTTQDSTWPPLLARGTGRPMYNLSMKGSPWHEFITLRVELSRLQLRPNAMVLWMLFSGNDLDEPYGPLDPARLEHPGLLGRARVAFTTFRGRSPVRRIWEASLRRARQLPQLGTDRVIATDFLNHRKLLFFRPYADVRHRSLDAVLADRHYPSLQATVTAMRALADSAGVRVRIIVAPSKEEVFSWVLDGLPAWTAADSTSGFSRAVCNLAAALAFECLDLKPLFLRESRQLYESTGEILWWYDDTHWNNRGNALAAAAIADAFLK
jgi:hypothetical protein